MEALIEIIKSTLLPRKEIVLAYLYGSFAKGISHPHSDVDVAILLDPDKNIYSKEYPYGYSAGVLADLIKALHTNRVDLIVLNNAPPFLKFQVIRYGRLVFSRSEAKRIDFQVKTITKYNDVKRLIDIQHRYLSNRLKNGTYGKR